MKIFGHKLLIFLLLGLFIQSCSKNEELLVVNVTKEFGIKLLEKLSPEDDKFELILTTLHSQSCINAEISYTDNQTVDKVGIRIDGVRNPLDCIPGVGPVSEYIPLSLNIGEIDIDISLKNEVVNPGKIILDSDSYSIYLETQHGIEYSPKIINRIPDNIIWGYASSTDEVTFGAIPEILNTLSNMSGISISALLEGDYGYFSINDQQTINDQNIPVNITEANEFIFSSDLSSEELQSYVDDLKSDNPLLEIRITTAEGQIIS